jgi:hypothetical protein
VNWRQKRSGHFFQGCYKVVLVDADILFVGVGSSEKKAKSLVRYTGSLRPGSSNFLKAKPDKIYRIVIQ